MNRQEPFLAVSGAVVRRPRIAEVEAWLEEDWHASTLKDEAQQTYEAWIALARAGLAFGVEHCLAEVWTLKKHDHLVSFVSFAEQSKLPLKPLVYVEQSQVLRGVYWVLWEEKPGRSWLRRTLKRLGQRIAEELPWFGGRFRMYSLRHPGTMDRLQRFPPNVARWAYLLGQRQEIEDAVVFEQYLEPDPILAVLVGGKWFEITRWE